MIASCEVLEQLYKTVLLGATLESDSHDYICHLTPAVAGQGGPSTTSAEWSDACGDQDRRQPSSVRLAPVPTAPVCWTTSSQRSSARETVLLQLTVIQVMLARVFSISIESRSKEKYRDVIKTLLQSAEVDSKLICMFQNSDKLLSHMAAKCLALLLYFQLREKIPLSDSWIAFCQKHLSEYPESDKAVYCLSTLTVVIKEILKDTSSQKTEIIKQLLTPLDTTFEAFYNSVFSQHFERCRDTSKVTNSLMSFLGLLELLTASGVYLQARFACQRVVLLKPSCMLGVMTWPVQAFVKRQLIILIKKCLLCKAGEDLCRGPVPAFLSPGHPADADTLALADAVLRAVDLGLLKKLSARGKPSCFGGDKVQPRGERICAPDYVILRAVSLVLMKSLEVKFQNCTSANEMKAALRRFMSELLAFLRPHLPPSLHGPCEWLPRVFIEQDDDMLEAAKAALGIYVKLTREHEATERLAPGETWDRHMHENGCNPHCIFLFFLKNVGFDASVLLDFLISSETCFLEYFVRYLKLLQKEWDNFFTICKSFDGTAPEPAMNSCGRVPSLAQGTSCSQAAPPQVTALNSHGRPCAWLCRTSGASCEPLSQAVTPKETCTMQAHRPSSPQVAPGLVDYDSSDDSEVECTGQSVANSKQASLHPAAVKAVQDTAGTSAGQELSRETPARPPLPKGSATSFSTDCEAPPKDTASEAGLFHRTVKCFRELQGAIYRLQKKSLFPYNATALLRLLKHVEAMYDKSMVALGNSDILSPGTVFP
ncbi:protein Lines homolog 1 isoform X1 [Oryctolagus cuniculus]|uniref:protein Lines homolog 1 isoform X1 n=2 Tax=Oryctolagus cuniculus TaxID=9986 RepID=UPI00387A11BB